MCCSRNKEFKAVSVRFFANPELEDRSVKETEAMCQKTIQRLEWLRDRHPRLVLMPGRVKGQILIRSLIKDSYQSGSGICPSDPPESLTASAVAF